MSNIKVNDFPTRKQYTYAGGAKVFVLDFPFFEDEDIFVYVSDPANNLAQEDPTNLLTYATEYTVTGAGLATGGTVTIDASVTLNVGFTVTVVGRMEIDRTSILETNSSITREQYNEDMNRLTMMIQDLNTIVVQTMPKYDRSEYINTSRANNAYSQTNFPALGEGEIWYGVLNNGDYGLAKAAIGDWDALGLLDVDYVIGTANPILTNAQVLGGQGTGLVYSTDDGTTGTVTTLTVGDGLEVDGNQINVTDSVNNLIEIPVTQPEHGLAVGDPVRIDTDGLFVLAQGDTPDNAEGVGIVSRLDATNPTDIFYFQMIGQIDLTGATKDYLPMTTGANYFLDADNEGELVTEPPIIAGQVKKAMIQARSPYTGLVLHYVGQIIGSLPGYADGGGGDEPGGDFDDVVGQECTTPTTIALTQGVWTDIPCLTQTITTGDAASGVQVHANITGDRTGSVSNTSLYIRIVRGTTVVGNGIQVGSELEANAMLFQDNTIQPILFVDYPGAAAAHTYKFQAYAISGAHTMYLQSDFINTMAGMSQLILTELTPA